MKRRRLITIAVLATALIVWLVVYLCTAEDNSRFTVVSDGPLDIRLWGIRPDAGDAIYDPNGKKIMDFLGFAQRETTVWKDSVYRHDFIFEMPDTNEPVEFHRLLYLVDGERQRGRFRTGSFHFEHNGRKLWWLKTAIPRTMRKDLLYGLWSRSVPIDKIDLSFRYYGPPCAPICVFKGPFEEGRKLSDETGLYEVSFVPHPDTSWTELVLRCCAKQGIAAEAIEWYDTDYRGAEPNVGG